MSTQAEARINRVLACTTPMPASPNNCLLPSSAPPTRASTALDKDLSRTSGQPRPGRHERQASMAAHLGKTLREVLGELAATRSSPPSCDAC